MQFLYQHIIIILSAISARLPQAGGMGMFVIEEGIGSFVKNISTSFEQLWNAQDTWYVPCSIATTDDANLNDGRTKIFRSDG